MTDSRVFFALWPDDTTAAALDQAAAKWLSDGRRVPRERLHLTLTFIGSVDAATIDALCERAATIEQSVFTLTLDRIGYFRRPRIVWQGPSHTPPPLVSLAQATATAAGFDRPAAAFRPHVSLARGVSRPDADTACAPVPWSVREFCLLESGRGGVPGGYTCLRRWRLGAA